jgi:hypothetical protein
MKESKYLKEDGDAQDDGEADDKDMGLFKKKSHKSERNQQYQHNKGFKGGSTNAKSGANSFARKRKRVK